MVFPWKLKDKHRKAMNFISIVSLEGSKECFWGFYASTSCWFVKLPVFYCRFKWKLNIKIKINQQWLIIHSSHHRWWIQHFMGSSWWRLHLLQTLKPFNGENYPNRHPLVNLRYLSLITTFQFNRLWMAYESYCCLFNCNPKISPSE